jgi:hypothetical protein
MVSFSFSRIDVPNEAPVHMIIDETKIILKLTQFDFLEQKLRVVMEAKVEANRLFHQHLPIIYLYSIELIHCFN